LKKLERSKEKQVIAGVSGGLGEYFNIDPVLFRIAFVLLTFADGIGVIAYIICWIAMPERKESETVDDDAPNSGGEHAGDDADSTKPGITRYLPGIALIGIGLVFLFNNLFFWFDIEHLWPLILVAVGILLILNAIRKTDDKE
jgi:phage shock protein C